MPRPSKLMQKDLDDDFNYRFSNSGKTIIAHKSYYSDKRYKSIQKYYVNDNRSRKLLEKFEIDRIKRILNNTHKKRKH